MTKKDKKVLIIRNWNNYELSKGEKNSGELLVVPDQSYTIPEIFEKFRRGIQLPLEREVSYSDTDDFDDIDLRSTVKDPFDIDDEYVRSRLSRRSGKVILDGGLPERTPEGLVSSDGVKTAGNNLNGDGEDKPAI